MKELLRRELWKMLLCLCFLAAAAALLWDRTVGGALPAWIPAALALWCLLLCLSVRLGPWGPAALCLLALSVCLLILGRSARDVSGLAALTAHPAFLPAALALSALPLWYAPDRFALRAGAALVWLGLWLTAALLGWELPRLTVTALLPLPLLAVCEARFCLLRRGSAPDYAPLRGWLCLVLVLASLLTLFAPAPAEPYGYPLVRRVIEKAEELLHDVESRISHRREGDLQFGLSFSGMAAQPEAGEDGGTEGFSCIYVQPYAATVGPLYLFANAWDRFDGQRWTQASPEEDEDGALLWNADTLEHLYALWRWQEASGDTDDERFFRTNHVYVYYGDMDTRTMFGAADALYFYYDDQRYPSTAGPNGILFDYMQERGTAYRMYWMETNARTLDRLIADSEGYVYHPSERIQWRSLKRRYEPRFHLDIAEDTALEVLLSRRQTLIRARDMDAEGVSPRAAALAAEITAGCRTDYEKLRAIASYLQSNYRYTLSPTPAPEGENFLDWLLFETGEGYCTWFATAAALLGRSVGVPTRYVQGYLAESLPVRSYTTLGPEAAHAWCEGYVAGYGWVTVEATPGFSAVGVGWDAADEAAGQAALPSAAQEAPQGEAQTDAAADGTESGGHTPQAAEAEPEPEAASAPRLWYLALLPAGLALVFAALVYLRRRKRWQRYLAASPEERVRQDLGRLLAYLRRRGYARAPETSIRACFDQLPWDYLPAEREQAMAMADFYESVLFGGHVPTAKEMSAQRTFVEAFRPRRRRLFR